MKLVLVAGARPNFMKVAPIIRAAQAHNAARTAASDVSTFAEQLSTILVHTGQHYDSKMSDIFFQELGIPAPDFNLEVGSGSHAVQTAQVMLKFEPVLLAERPDWVVVVGDVNSTVACALVASKLGTKVAHVEAGLRSLDRTMPEEINRLVTDSISDLLLTPSEDADQNLLREGVPASRIRRVGNIMIDALVANLETVARGDTLQRLGLEKRRFAYVTLHRPSNVDSPDALGQIMEALRNIARQMPVIFPVHPRTRQRLADVGFSPGANGRLRLIEPVGYHDSLALTRHARCVLTDSGGLQEESTFFRTPCLTLRPNTERPITITLGSNQLVTVEQLQVSLAKVLHGPEELGQVPPLWDGKAAGRVLGALHAS